MGHRLGLTTGAQISVCKAPSLSTSPAVPLTGRETVQLEPLMIMLVYEQCGSCLKNCSFLTTTVFEMLVLLPSVTYVSMHEC